MPHWSLIYLVSEWVIRFAMLVYVPQRRNAAASRTWLLLIFLLPWPGLLIYGLFGRIRVSRRRLEMQEKATERIREGQSQIRSRVVINPELPAHLTHLPALAEKLGEFEVFGGNAIELIADYDAAIDRLIADIDDAESHVHILTYILGADDTAGRLVAALERATARGVTCCLLADAVGSRAGLSRWRKTLSTARVEVVALLRVGFFRENAARFDLRNHRKLAVIDGCIGHIGSQNLVDPHFVRSFPNEELVARVSGPVVGQMQAVLLADRSFEIPSNIVSRENFPEMPSFGLSSAQLLPSGPGYQRENAEEFFIALLYAARRRVVITTPYFVPDEPFLEAVRSAARREVEVRLIFPLRANQRITQFAQRSYYEDLLRGGVHIHLYRPRFLHAKHLTVDDDIALIGSTNIDIRSFSLNCEVSLITYDRAVVAEVRAVQERYLADSEELDLESWGRRSVPDRVLQNLARLTDSLL